MKSFTPLLTRHNIALSIISITLLLTSYLSYLFFYFLQNGGVIVFCHDVVFSPAYKECRESVESYFLSILIIATVTAILATIVLILKTISLPERKTALKRFLLFFVPVAIVLLLLGVVPIEFGLGMLGSATIYLLLPIACCLGIVFILSLIYINMLKRWSIFIVVPAVLIICTILIIAHLYTLGLLEAVANHDRDLDSYPRRTEDCDKFWYERYRQRCEDRKI